MSGKVLDFVQKRLDLIEERRQGIERLVFKNLLGSYVVLEEEGDLTEITMVDISFNGCGFETVLNTRVKKIFQRGEQVKIRMYFTKNSFILGLATVIYATEIFNLKGNAVLRVGCQFDKTIGSYTALYSFIDFLYKFAKYATRDDGTSKSFFF